MRRWPRAQPSGDRGEPQELMGPPRLELGASQACVQTQRARYQLAIWIYFKAAHCFSIPPHPQPLIPAPCRVPPSKSSSRKLLAPVSLLHTAPWCQFPALPAPTFPLPPPGAPQSARASPWPSGRRSSAGNQCCLPALLPAFLVHAHPLHAPLPELASCSLQGQKQAGVHCPALGLLHGCTTWALCGGHLCPVWSPGPPCPRESPKLASF